MRIDRSTLIGLVVALAVIFGLAAWGEHLGLSAETLTEVRTAASAFAALGLALMRSLIAKDDDKDGIPDIFQAPRPNTAIAPPRSASPPDLPRQRLIPPAIVLALALTGGMWVGCGANPAQVALSTQAEIVKATQPVRFDAYGLLDERCGAEHSEREAYRACMMPARHVARAADSYRETLQGAQALLDLGEGAAAVPCVIEAAKAFLRAATAAQVPVPSDVHEFAAMIPAGECHAADQ